MRLNSEFNGATDQLKGLYTHHIRVRYGETDAMGYVYYGNYAEFFEVGRNEIMRHLGLTYASLEARGIMMPVAEMVLTYRQPAHYDEELRIHTGFLAMHSASVLFGYRIDRVEDDALIVYGQTLMPLVSAETRQPVRIPADLRALLDPLFA